MTSVTKTGNRRLMATVDQATADEVQRLADALGMSVAKMLGILIGIAVRSSGATIAEVGEQFGVIMGGPTE